MRLLYLLPLFLLTACVSDTVVVTHTKLEVVLPSDTLYRCPAIKYPDFATLTDKQVAQLLVQMHKSNVTCRNSQAAIKRFLIESKKIIEETP